MFRLEISSKGILLLVLTLVVVWAFIELWAVVVLVLFALILMIGLLPFVEAIARRGIPRSGAVIFILIASLAVIAGLLGIMAPPMVEELKNVRDNLPDSAREIEELLARFGIGVELQERARNIDWSGLISGRAAVSAGQRVLTTTVSTITIVVMTAYLLADTPRLARFVTQFIPVQRRSEANELFLSLSRVVGGYLRGQLITSLCIGVFVFFLLQVMNVPNSLAFAVLAGFADVIPLIGALIAIIPPTAAALQESSTKALFILAALTAYQQFEDRYLVPRVYGRTLNLPPIIVLVAVLAGAELLGVTGVLLALPLAAAARVGVDFVMAEGRLPLMGPGEQAPTADSPPRERRRISAVVRRTSRARSRRSEADPSESRKRSRTKA